MRYVHAGPGASKGVQVGTHILVSCGLVSLWLEAQHKEMYCSSPNQSIGLSDEAQGEAAEQSEPMFGIGHRHPWKRSHGVVYLGIRAPMPAVCLVPVGPGLKQTRLLGDFTTRS